VGCLNPFLFEAGVGRDACTGLATRDGTAILDNLR